MPNKTSLHVSRPPRLRPPVKSKPHDSDRDPPPPAPPSNII